MSEGLERECIYVGGWWVCIRGTNAMAFVTRLKERQDKKKGQGLLRAKGLVLFPATKVREKAVEKKGQRPSRWKCGIAEMRRGFLTEEVSMSLKGLVDKTWR